ALNEPALDLFLFNGCLGQRLLPLQLLFISIPDRFSLFPAAHSPMDMLASLFDGRQLLSIQVRHPRPGLGGGNTKDSLAESVQTTFVVDDDEITPVALGKGQVFVGKRRLETPAAIRPLVTIADRLANLVNIETEPPCLFLLPACRGKFDGALTF